MRQRVEIMTDILTLCTTPTKKTHIMYRTNLSYTQLKNYLLLLTSQGLLRSNSGEYAATDKGLRFLDAFARMSEVLEDDSYGLPHESMTHDVKEAQIIRITQKRISNRPHA